MSADALALAEDGAIGDRLARNTEHLIFEDSPTNKLLIVFAYINQPIGTGSHASFLAGTGCKKLFLNPGRNHWYQDGVPGVCRDFDGLIAFAAAVRSRFPDHEILCLGHSMGAFAALGVGVAIGAQRVLASVPELEVNLPGSVSIHHMAGVPVQHGDLSALLQGNEETHITAIVGRQNPFDMAMAARLAAMPLVEIVEIDSDHSTFPYLRDMGKLKGVMSRFVADEALAPWLAGC